VATAVGGNVELIEDGVTGLLVEPGQPGAVAGAIDRLLQDPAMAVRLGAAASSRVREKYDQQVATRRYERFYEELTRTKVANKGPSAAGVGLGGGEVRTIQALPYQGRNA
jgi:glycosyltransferase involved in cell wall biosynthesis